MYYKNMITRIKAPLCGLALLASQGSCSRGSDSQGTVPKGYDAPDRIGLDDVKRHNDVEVSTIKLNPRGDDNYAFDFENVEPIKRHVLFKSRLLSIATSDLDLDGDQDIILRVYEKKFLFLREQDSLRRLEPLRR